MESLDLEGMCTFISLIAASRDTGRLNDFLSGQDRRDYRRRAEIVTTPCVAAVLSAGEREFCLVRSPCDCGTYLGSKIAAGPPLGKMPAGKAAGYRRKGWLAAKIERAVASKRATEARPKRRGPNEDAAYWIDLLTGVCQALSVNRVGLMHHFFNIRPGIDDFPIDRMTGGRIHEAAELLARMADGVVYDFAGEEQNG